MKPADSLRAEEWQVLPCSEFEAVNMVRRYHYSKAIGCHPHYKHGLYRADEWFGAESMGVAIWMNAVYLSKRFDLPAGPLMLTRLVVHPDMPTNAASFLLAASMRLIDRQTWPVLVTYADTALGHTGAIYKATNWTYDGEGGHVCYYHPETGEQKPSLGPTGSFLPCPPGWVERTSVKHRFIHMTKAYRRARHRMLVATAA
jgi:hypothetical protein